MDETGAHYTEWSKPERKIQSLPSKTYSTETCIYKAKKSQMNNKGTNLLGKNKSQRQQSLN